MRIVVAVHEPPVWTIPESEVRSIQASLPNDDVIDARTADARLRAFEGADVLVTYRIAKPEVPVLEVAQAAVQHVARRAARARGEVAAIHHDDADPVPCGQPRDEISPGRADAGGPRSQT